MNKLSVGRILCIKWILLNVLITFNVDANTTEIFTKEDRAMIEQRKSASQSVIDLEQFRNPHESEAKIEALEFYAELQQSNPTLKDMQKRQQEKNTYTEHSLLVFASLSMGESGIDDLLDAASGNDDVVIVFRGIPEEMTFSEGILYIQSLAKTKDPVPNIVINPVLFKEHNITVVPTIVMLDKSRGYSEIARVAGLSDSSWLARRVNNHEKGDQGIKGAVEKIIERDLIDLAKERMAQIDWNEKKEQAIANFWHKHKFNELPPATEHRIRHIDPSIYISADITAQDGTMIVKQGDIINPLSIRPFTQTVIVFDPLDKKQMERLANYVPKILTQKVVYIVTKIDRERGWESYKEITDNLDSPVFLLTPDIINRFELKFLPSVITANDNKFVVEELAGNNHE